MDGADGLQRNSPQPERIGPATPAWAGVHERGTEPLDAATILAIGRPGPVLEARQKAIESRLADPAAAPAEQVLLRLERAAIDFLLDDRRSRAASDRSAELGGWGQ